MHYILHQFKFHLLSYSFTLLWENRENASFSHSLCHDLLAFCSVLLFSFFNSFSPSSWSVLIRLQATLSSFFFSVFRLFWNWWVLPRYITDLKSVFFATFHCSTKPVIRSHHHAPRLIIIFYKLYYYFHSLYSTTAILLLLTLFFFGSLISNSIQFELNLHSFWLSSNEIST